MRQDRFDPKQVFDRSFVLPSPAQTDSSCERVLERLNAGSPRKAKEHAELTRPRKSWWPLPLRVAAAVVFAALLLIPLLKTFVFPENVYAVVQVVQGPLYRVSNGELHAVSVGDKIDAGKILRTEDGAGSVLRLSDGSRVEMRRQTELSVKRVRDGVQIQLTTGSILVTPSKEPTGMLYVQAQENTVPVTAMTFQSAAPAKQNTGVEPSRLRFEAVSLRPVSQTPVQNGGIDRLFRCRGTDGSFRATTGTLLNLAAQASELAAVPPSAEVPLGRCVGLVHPRQLVAQAYNIATPTRQVLSDFEWPEIYQIEAKASDPATTTTAQLREMLQSLLADRYAFKMHRETRNGEGCALRIAKSGIKFKETTGVEGVDPTAPAPVPGAFFFKGKFRMKTFASSLFFRSGNVEIEDQTGLPGLYDLSFRVDAGVAPPANPDSPPAGARGGGGGSPRRCEPRFSEILEDQLGLILQPATVPTEFIVVDHIEKPTAN